ncbi:MAG: hypothetical protein DWH94_05060 [Planctomycetota bacterium]|nr:MAG: hypothetical protein DWH94_05060 [Planctomycetota bacterium]
MAWQAGRSWKARQAATVFLSLCGGCLDSRIRLVSRTCCVQLFVLFPDFFVFMRRLARASPPWMPLYLACNALFFVAIMLSGCKLVSRGGPVSKELTTARRLSNEGLAAANEDDLVRAEGLLERAVRACPADIDARRYYADVLWKRGSRVEAVGQMAEALRMSQGDVSTTLAAGRMYLELGLLDDADSLSQSSVSLAPRSSEAWHLHGQVALARGRTDDALADFHKSLSLSPDDRDVLKDTAEVYQHQKRPQRTLSTLAHLSETYGSGNVPSSILTMEGRAHEALGRRQEALLCYRRAIATGEDSKEAVEHLAALEGGKPIAKVATAPQGNSTTLRP